MYKEAFVIDWNIEVYDKNRKRIAILSEAYHIGYTKEKDRLSTAQFTLRIDDMKNEYCKPFHYIKLYENKEYIDMYRIMPLELVKDENTKEITYYCEHVLGTLLDTSLFRYHEIGGIGTYTTDILQFILNKQSNWKLGRCDFNRQFQYSWENENLLSAFFSIPKEFDEDYSITWDTSIYPWVVNLIRPSDEVKAYLRYERNMKGIKKREDGSVVCTRLYALGYGEGINQLGIEKINPTKKPYIEAEADIIKKYGIIEKIWCDRRYQIEETLFYAAKAKLDKIKQTKVTYEIDAAELFGITGIPIDKFDEGDIVRVIDKELGVDITTRIIMKSKKSIENDFISTTVRISSDGGNSTSGLSDLYERAKINDTNSQGATNINNYSYYGNCDKKYPAKIRIKIPEEAVNINKVDLSFQADAFRAFSKAIKGGGGVSSTTSSGGGTSTTTDSGGGTYDSTESGGATYDSTESGGGTYDSTRDGRTRVRSFGAGLWQLGSYDVPGDFAMSSAGEDNHVHSFNSRHYHDIELEDHYHMFEVQSHKHRFEVQSHRHRFEVQSHRHNLSIASHRHDITLNNHIHEIEYGIYEGPSSSKFTVYVDGKLTTLKSTADDFNIVEYLNKDDSGLIVRGWHEVVIYPDNLCMINADVMVQVFVNSRGGGNY